MKKHGNLVAQFDELMDSCEQAEDVTSFYIRGLCKKILTRILSRSPCAKVAKGVCTLVKHNKNALFRKMKWKAVEKMIILEVVYIFNGSSNTVWITTAGGEPLQSCDQILGVHCSEHKNGYNKNDQYNMCLCACVIFIACEDKSSVNLPYCFRGKLTDNRDRLCLDDIWFNKMEHGISPTFDITKLSSEFLFWINKRHPKYTVIFLHYMGLRASRTPFCVACDPTWNHVELEWRHMKQCQEHPNEPVAHDLLQFAWEDVKVMKKEGTMKLDDIIGLLRFVYSIHPTLPFTQQVITVEATAKEMQK
eukprot:357029_1